MSAVYVGNVPFTADRTGGKYACGMCKAVVAPCDVARHAHKRHRAHACGVLAGQLAFPHFDLQDIPGK